jgi:hypothetical protein
MATIDRLAVALSRRRLLGAALASTLLALLGDAAAAETATPTETPVPTDTPTETPTEAPTETATPTETPVPTDTPTETPTEAPTETATPTEVATETTAPTDVPTEAPTEVPTATAIPTETPTPDSTATFTPTAVPTATPSPTATPTGAPEPVGSVLLSWYGITAGHAVDYRGMAYRPRQFRAGLAVPDGRWGAYAVVDDGGYAGFDLLRPPNYGGADGNADWLTVGLNRRARVGVVWRGGAPPSWLASWRPGVPIRVRSDRWGTEAYRTYWTDVPAGDTVLPGTGHAGWDDYWVLLAEDGGIPSGDPMPGVAPNAPCPFHPAFSYHPHIDPVSWCYHGHEHGTNPASLGVDWDPGFGRAAAAMGMGENDQGFKLMGWVQNGVRWIFGMHQGTSGPGRLCVRHHTTILAAWNDATGAPLLDLQWMGDYGAAVRNNPPDLCIARPECPDQCGAFPGTRQIPTLADGNTGYEPWRVAVEGNVVGLVGSPLFNTLDSVTSCDEAGDGVSSWCALVVNPGASGSKRFFQGNRTGVLNPPVTGEFWTDPTLMALRQPGDPDAVRQWIAPGIADLRIATNKVWDVDGFGRIGTPSQDDILYVSPTEREDSIPTGAPN